MSFDDDQLDGYSNLSGKDKMKLRSLNAHQALSLMGAEPIQRGEEPHQMRFHVSSWEQEELLSEAIKALPPQPKLNDDSRTLHAKRRSYLKFLERFLELGLDWEAGTFVDVGAFNTRVARTRVRIRSSKFFLSESMVSAAHVKRKAKAAGKLTEVSRNGRTARRKNKITSNKRIKK